MSSASEFVPSWPDFHCCTFAPLVTSLSSITPFTQSIPKSKAVHFHEAISASNRFDWKKENKLL